MKLLVQDSNKNLVWQDVIYKDKHFHPIGGPHYYAMSDIYAIKDDDRNKLVTCSACGAEIPNTPSAIRAHRNMVHKSNKCFDCYYLKHVNEKTISQKYVLNEDGTYTEATKRTVSLLCKMNYRTYDINSEEAKSRCKYAPCERATFNPISDFWTKYPNAFNEFITIDRIIDAGYKSMHKFPDYLKFELNGRQNILAYVNNQGVCYSFCLRHRSNFYTARYSKKYDKVWVYDCGYIKELSSLDIADSTKKAILDKFRNLYK